MNVAWLILDSLSFSATPFRSDEYETMSKIKTLADDIGIVFTQCYSPGTASPSSHASFFTGKYPSEVGMHSANPQFSGNYPTLADATKQTHNSLLVTNNLFLGNGLQNSFDKFVDTRTNNYPFPEATTTLNDSFSKQFPLERYYRFISKNGKPTRSVINGIYNKLFFDSGIGYENDIDQINDKIIDFADSNDRYAVVANYMAAHAPFRPSNKAIQKFSGKFSQTELPIGESGQKIHQRYKTESEYNAEDMYALYLASIWELDNKITPVIERLLSQDTIVFVTADHGNWFRRDSELDESRIHVPLIMLPPEKLRGSIEPGPIDYTVNLRHLAATTTSLLRRENEKVNNLPGKDLLSIEKDLVSLTEFIHHDSAYGQPVTPDGIKGSNEQLIYKIAAISNGCRVDYDGGTKNYNIIRDLGPKTDRIIDQLKEHVSTPINPGPDSTIEYDDQTEEHLRELGYLE